MTGLRNARFTLAYDGTDFRGVAISSGVRTVMGVLSDTVSQIVRHPVDFTLAGRTDAGVHAHGQVINGRLPARTDLDRVVNSVNKMLRPEIALREPSWTDEGFSARFDATSRSYRYDVWNDAVPNPMLARYSWHVGTPLRLDAMNVAASGVVGEHDFTSFCRRPKRNDDEPEPRMTRRVLAARWRRVDASPLIRFEITGTSFCHQMVRSVVGTLVEIGAGRRAVDSIAATIEARDRSAAGQIAPPNGLVLWSVDYSGERWDA